jgi:peptidoglycan hydrolase-like protein with peptidoglycan-binding domain
MMPAEATMNKNAFAAMACGAFLVCNTALAQTDAAAGDGAAAPDPVVAALTAGEQQTKAVQQALIAAGFDPGPADGDWGPASWTALKDWRTARQDLVLTQPQTRAYSHLVSVAPPEAGVMLPFVNGQHMVVPAAGETRPFQWDTQANAWKAPKDFKLGDNSQGWVMLKTASNPNFILVFDGARMSPEGQILLGRPLGSRRLFATLTSKDGKTLGRVGCRIGEAALISDVVVPCGYNVAASW